MATNPPDDSQDNTPDKGPDDSGPGSQQNPFAGTPMEQMFQAFSGGQMPDMNVIMSQMQRMFAPHEGSVNWELATEIARHTVAQSPDPSVTTADTGAVSDAVRLAELWLDGATSIPAGATTSAAWSRAEWIEATSPTWRTLVEPIAEHVVTAMSDAVPEEAKQMAGPLMGFLGQAGGAMFGQQIGRALGELAAEVVSTTDVGLPLGPDGVAAILPRNVKEFGEGLGVTPTDVTLYLVLRECAHHRLFAHAPWLRARLVGAIEEFGRGTRIDMSRIEESMRDIDPTNPNALNEALSGGLFEPTRTPEQQSALERLELLLALVEGWVDEVVSQATDERMPAAKSLREAVRRRRAAGGPAEETFASLVGLELRPRRLRDAAHLWAALRDRQGAEARDAVWAHPDLLPSAADLDDPLGFATDDDTRIDDEDFDAALADLLDSAGESSSDDESGEGDESAGS
ncbi:zinc-dependent metalloprotease [Nocardioidaceae bacterium SCSIO 66511]|nr:zinc-dependent metalloprotease [Nocardioidaceae bacterium SCSIO 66511]